MDKNTLIDHLLEHISKIKKDDVYEYKRRAHISVINKIKKNPHDQITEEIIDEMDLTSNMKEKLIKLINSKTKPKLPLELQLQKINGIGPTLAKKLVQLGVKSIGDLKRKLYYEILPINAQVYVKYKPMEKIPRVLIDKVYSILSSHFKKYKIGKFDFVGSYRRGSLQSSDIDVLINKHFIDTCDDFIKFLNLSNLKVYEPYAKGNQKISTIAKIGTNHVKIDFFITPVIEYPFALLYSTGSRELNIKMRQIASDMGYLLNHKGLFDKNNKKRIGNIKSERGIFTALKMSYIDPKKR